MPEIEHTITQRFSGNVAYTPTAKVPAVLTLEYKKYEASEIVGELMLARELAPTERMWANGMRIPEQLIFEAQPPGQTRICLRLFSSVSNNQVQQTYNAHICEIDLLDTPISELEFAHVCISLTNGKCLSKWGHRELHFDGNIKTEPGYPEEIQWTTDVGKAEARMRYVYEDVKESDAKAIIQMTKT